MSPASVLNPHAQSFHPRFYEPLDFGAVYNDGLPTATLAGSPHETLRDIPDQALDEAFPPSADEAAELDAAMDFVLTMSYLGVVEEQEERARSTFSHVGKRWEARRVEGLGGAGGRPNPARSKLNTAVAGNHRSFSKDTTIVQYDWTAKKAHVPFHDMESVRAREVGRGQLGRRAQNNNNNHNGRGGQRPIQQPRKQHR